VRKDNVLFNDWPTLLRVGTMSVLAYFFLLAVLRVAGKRSLAKRNLFGLVVTVAFGSLLATVVLSREVTLAQGAVAFIVLAGLQWAVAKASRRWTWAATVFRSSPRLLFHRGEFDDAAMAAERVTRNEILQSVRSSGAGTLDGVAAVVLESDGSFSVVKKDKAGDESALADVVGMENATQ
jgi:uncharacterized membrane protein YcaP (DUF421 family)